MYTKKVSPAAFFWGTIDNFLRSAPDPVGAPTRGLQTAITKETQRIWEEAWEYEAQAVRAAVPMETSTYNTFTCIFDELTLALRSIATAVCKVSNR